MDVDIHQLRAMCEAQPWLRVLAEGGGDWSALLPNWPANFVDVYSPCDRYPARLWADAEEYFVGLREVEMVLPGGRYSCAQALLARNLPFLSGRSLGQVCHVVQLAI